MADIKKEVEAILFAAGRVVRQDEIELLLEIKTPGMVKDAVNDLKNEYSQRDSPILLIDEAEGWKLTVKEQFLPIVQKINPHTEFSKAVMETLAVIAWKQPILQSRIVEIRSNKAYEHIAELVELGFISKERYGRSYMLKPTQKFLDYFDLPDQEAAKKVFRDFKDEDIQKQLANMKQAEGDEEHLGNLEVYDAGSEQDTYDDRRALAKKRSPLGDLEVFEEPDEQEATEEVKEPAEKDEETERSEGEAPIEEAETDGEKAKKLAEKLLAEDAAPEEELPEEDVTKREVHPALEEFLEDEKKPEEKTGEKHATELVEEGQAEKHEEKGAQAEKLEKPAEEKQARGSAGEELSEKTEKPAEEKQAEATEASTDDAYEQKRKALEDQQS
ncbi:MAG: SMC-Scp complex subunit ScpB [Candidatus Nanoarchaeia archaeon]